MRKYFQLISVVREATLKKGCQLAIFLFLNHPPRESYSCKFCLCDACFFPAFSIEFLWQFMMDWHFGIVFVILGQQLPKTLNSELITGGGGVWFHNLHV